MRSVIAPEQTETRQDRLRLGLLAVLLGATFLMGGSARSDVLSLLFLRPLTTGIFVAAVMTALPLAWRRAPSAVTVGTGSLLLCLLHLVPLPPGIWTALPGRQIAMEVYRAAGMSPSWHPLTLTPQHTWNAVFFLLAPLSALILALSLTPAQVRRLLAILIGLVLLNAGIGALQSLGTPSLHFYEITNRDFAVGLFANRNHAALSFACALPLLGIYIDARGRREARWRLSAPLAVTAALLLVPMILLTGSRAGLVWAALALPMMLWVHGQSVRPDRRTAAWPWIGVMVLGVAAIFVLKERAPALLRLAETGSASELRLNAVPAIWQAVGDFWPWGSGIGSFVEVYGIYEPSHLLGAAYLNHAHNDVLELLLTGGLPAALLAAAGAASLVRAATAVNAEPADASRDTADNPRWARAGLSITILLSLASTVDYPLRTPILAVLLAVAAALVVRRNPRPLNHGAVHHDSSEPSPRRRRRAHLGGTERPMVRNAA